MNFRRDQVLPWWNPFVSSLGAERVRNHDWYVKTEYGYVRYSYDIRRRYKQDLAFCLINVLHSGYAWVKLGQSEEHFTKYFFTTPCLQWSWVYIAEPDAQTPAELARNSDLIADAFRREAPKLLDESYAVAKIREPGWGCDSRKNYMEIARRLRHINPVFAEQWPEFEAWIPSVVKWYKEDIPSPVPPWPQEPPGSRKRR